MNVVLNSLAALVPFLLLVPYRTTKEFFDPTERNVSVRYRGFFALLVILHHMAQRVSEGGLVYLYYDIGFFAVAVFFFYSGYGMMKKGLALRKNYFRRRIPKLLLPYVITMVIYWLLYALFGDVKSLVNLLSQHLYSESGISFLWYVIVYLDWLLFLGIALRFMKKDRQIMTAAWLFTAGFIVFCLLVLPYYFWIYDTVLLLPLGCVWAYHEEKILAGIQKHYSPVLIISLVLLAASWFTRKISFLMVPGIMLTAILFVFVLNVISMKWQPQGKVLSFLGGISYEIYILHGIPITFLKNFLPEGVWTISVPAIAVCLAYLMHEAGKRLWLKA